ncbi:alkaline phosphatase [Paenibacillus sp. 7028]|nr:alkaline phosphatase [Paenibacillus apii]
MVKWNKRAALLAAAFGLSALITGASGAGATANTQASGELRLVRLASYSTGAGLAKSGAEIVHYDKASRKAYLINGDTKSFEIVDLSGLKSGVENQALAAENKFKITDFNPTDSPGLFGDITSIAVHPTENLIAAAVPNSVKTEPGSVVFFTKTGEYLGYERVGALPDMITLTPDGSRFLVANEGEPADADYNIDPEGSVSIIDIAKTGDGHFSFNVTTAGFGSPDLAIDGNVRYASLKTGHVANPTPEQWAADLEPEFITVSADSAKAYVALQENNAIGMLDLKSKRFTHIYGLGYKNHMLPQNKLDVSDEDKTVKIQNYPVLGAYMPDGISLRTIGGKTYLFTANEGDGREWGGAADEVKFRDIYASGGPKAGNVVKLDAKYYPGTTQDELDAINLGALSEKTGLGNLRITNTVSDIVYKDTVTGVTYYNALVAYGARSFSIWDVDKLGTPEQQVYDSGDDFEQYIAANYPSVFNSDHEANKMDNRSDNKGPEPEYVETGEAFGRTYAFVGLERQSGVIVYNVSNPQEPQLASYFNLRDLVNSGQGDLGPEGLDFIPAGDSPTGKPLLLAGNEVSGTMAVLELQRQVPFKVQPQEDGAVYSVSDNNGVPVMTVKDGVSGLKTFSANVQTVLGHSGAETVVFTHRRGSQTLGLTGVRGDFDNGGYAAQIQFNVQAGDTVEVYVVDELTNDPGRQPVVLQ